LVSSKILWWVLLSLLSLLFSLSLSHKKNSPNSLSFLLLPSSLLLLLLLLHPEEERLGLDELPPSKLALGKQNPQQNKAAPVHKQTRRVLTNYVAPPFQHHKSFADTIELMSSYILV
jgi:hypothetical protein